MAETTTKEIEKFNTDEEDFDTVMARDIIFDGNIYLEKSLMIKGKVHGTIESTSDLLIDTDAEIIADIKAQKVYVRGKIQGNVEAPQLLHVAATGSIEGDISAGQVVMEPGALFSGKCTMIGGEQK